jgi:hypothetical protein
MLSRGSAAGHASRIASATRRWHPSTLEALELFFETAPPDEVSRRLSNEVYVTQLEVAVG